MAGGSLLLFGLGRRWTRRQRRRGLPAEGGIDHYVERLHIERGERDLDAIDEQNRGPVDSDGSAAFLIRRDACLHLLSVHVFFETFDIQSKRGGIAGEDCSYISCGFIRRGVRPRAGYVSPKRTGTFFAPILGILKQ